MKFGHGEGCRYLIRSRDGLQLAFVVGRSRVVLEHTIAAFRPARDDLDHRQNGIWRGAKGDDIANLEHRHFHRYDGNGKIWFGIYSLFRSQLPLSSSCARLPRPDHCRRRGGLDGSDFVQASRCGADRPH